MCKLRLPPVSSANTARWRIQEMDTLRPSLKNLIRLQQTGIVRPSILAVLRLMTSSNLVGCSMGLSWQY